MANLKFHNALAAKSQATPPIWFMRQAGRYHSHYRALRERYSFIELCKIPEVAAEVAMGPMNEFDFDVAILFSDLLFPLEALGLGLSYDPSPKLGRSLSKETITTLLPLEKALPQLQFQADALKATRARLPADKSLIGFVGGPWTLYVYAVEGGHSGSLQKAKAQPELYQRFCEQLVPLLEANIALQLAAGAELVMLFDTAAGELSPGLFQELVMPELERLAKRFPKQLGYYSKGTTPYHLESPLFREGIFAGIGVDHRFDLRRELQQKRPGFLQGNFDQALLFLDERDFRRECERFYAPLLTLSPAERAGWVAGLGHGVLPATPERNVHALIEYIRENFR